MKTTRDFDLSFRPETYWEHADPIAAILAGIKGEVRRKEVLAALQAGKELPEGLLDSELDEDTRRAWGAIHPLLMGGEYLPPDLPGETTIARIALRSTTGDVIEIRARPGVPGIRYRIVDEYDTDFILPFDRSQEPLSMGELIDLIDRSQGMGEVPGLVLHFLDRSFGRGNRWGKLHAEWLTSVRRFVTVSSEHYPDLGSYYEAAVEEWLAERGFLAGEGGVGDASAAEESVTEGQAVYRFAEALNTLNAELVVPLLSPDVEFTSQEVLETLRGRDAVADHLRRKMATVRANLPEAEVRAELGRCGGQPGQPVQILAAWPERPCVVVQQGPSPDPTGLILLTVAEGRIRRIDLCTVAPAPGTAYRTGNYPGLATGGRD